MSLYEFNNEWVQKYIHPNILDIPDIALAVEEQKVNNVGTDIFVVPILLVIISVVLGFIERRKRHQKYIVRETN